MAKKKKTTLSLADLNKSLLKVAPDAQLIEESSSKITEWIGTGNYHLNALMCGDIFKGIPNNRVIELAGESGVGKTYLMMNLCKIAQEMGYTIYYFDTENAIDDTLTEKFGIDSSKFMHIPTESVQQFRNIMTNVIMEILEVKDNGGEYPKVFFGLDSLGNLASEKEIQDARNGSEKADMTRAKIIKSAFRILTPKLGRAGMPLVYTNHVYIDPVSFIPKVISGGGKGPEYNASMKLLLAKKQLKEGTTKVGVIVKAKSDKNRFVKPEQIEFHIDFRKGMNPYVGLEQYVSWELCGIERGKLKKNKDELIFEPPKKESDNVTKTTTFAVKHLGRHVKAAEFFTPEVFTKEVLEKLKPVILERFSFGQMDVENDFDILTNGESDEEFED